MIVACVITTMLAAACAGGSRRGSGDRVLAISRHRLGGMLPAGASDPDGPNEPPPGRPGRSIARAAVSAVVLFAGALTVGGPGGVALGGVGAAVVFFVRPTAAVVRVDPDDLPVVVDLVAGCLAAGATLPDALEIAAVAADDVVRAACDVVVAALRSGAAPEEAWQAWLSDPWLAPVARTAVRTARTGAAAADDLSRTATRLRARRRSETQHRVRRAAVWLVVPLGLCFLPAFVLVAVVPLVVGLVPSLR
jgi:pilus assembly protein TadC